jgi:hypothetical protein
MTVVAFRSPACLFSSREGIEDENKKERGKHLVAHGVFFHGELQGVVLFLGGASLVPTHAFLHTHTRTSVLDNDKKAKGQER